MMRLSFFLFLCLANSISAQDKILEIPSGDIPIDNFLYKADPDGFVCFVLSGSNGGTKKSKSVLYLVKQDSVLKVFSGLDRLSIWAITSTQDAFMVLVLNVSKQFELFTINKYTGYIRKKALPELMQLKGVPLSCLTESGLFYMIHYEKVKKQRSFLISTLDSTGRIETKRFENKIPLIDAKLQQLPTSIIELEPDRRLTMIEAAAQKKFIKRNNAIHFFIDGADYHIGEIYDMTEVFTMNLETGESSFRTIPDEKILGTANTNSAIIDNHLYRVTIYRDYIEFKIYDFESGILKKSYEIYRTENVLIKNSAIYSKDEAGIEVETKLESTKKLLAKMAKGYGFVLTDFKNDSTINFKIGAYVPPSTVSFLYYGPYIGGAIVAAAATVIANAMLAEKFGYTYFNATLNTSDFSPLPSEQIPNVVRQIDAFEQALRNSGNRISELIHYSIADENYVAFYNRLTKAIEVHRLN